MARRPARMSAEAVEQTMANSRGALRGRASRQGGARLCRDRGGGSARSPGHLLVGRGRYRQGPAARSARAPEAGGQARAEPLPRPVQSWPRQRGARRLARRRAGIRTGGGAEARRAGRRLLPRRRAGGERAHRRGGGALPRPGRRPEARPAGARTPGADPARKRDRRRAGRDPPRRRGSAGRGRHPYRPGVRPWRGAGGASGL